MEEIIGQILSVVTGAFFLWVGMKVTKVDGTFVSMLIIALVSALLGYIPMIGWILGLVAMFLLIRKLTDAEIWPDAVLMVVVAGIAQVLTVAAMISLLNKL